MHGYWHWILKTTFLAALLDQATTLRRVSLYGSNGKFPLKPGSMPEGNTQWNVTVDSHVQLSFPKWKLGESDFTMAICPAFTYPRLYSQFYSLYVAQKNESPPFVRSLDPMLTFQLFNPMDHEDHEFSAVYEERKDVVINITKVNINLYNVNDLALSQSLQPNQFMDFTHIYTILFEEDVLPVHVAIQGKLNRPNHIQVFTKSWTSPNAYSDTWHTGTVSTSLITDKRHVYVFFHCDSSARVQAETIDDHYVIRFKSVRSQFTSAYMPPMSPTTPVSPPRSDSAMSFVIELNPKTTDNDKGDADAEDDDGDDDDDVDDGDETNSKTISSDTKIDTEYIYLVKNHSNAGMHKNKNGNLSPPFRRVYQHTTGNSPPGKFEGLLTNQQNSVHSDTGLDQTKLQIDGQLMGKNVKEEQDLGTRANRVPALTGPKMGILIILLVYVQYTR